MWSNFFFWTNHCCIRKIILEMLLMVNMLGHRQPSEVISSVVGLQNLHSPTAPPCAESRESNFYKVSAWEQLTFRWSHFKRVRNHILTSYQGVFLHPEWSVQVWNLKVQHINVWRAKRGFHLYIFVHVKLNLLAGHGEQAPEEILPQLWTSLLFSLHLLRIGVRWDASRDGGVAQSDKAGGVRVKSTTVGVGTFREAEHRHWHCHADVFYA